MAGPKVTIGMPLEHFTFFLLALVRDSGRVRPSTSLTAFKTVPLVIVLLVGSSNPTDSCLRLSLVWRPEKSKSAIFANPRAANTSGRMSKRVLGNSQTKLVARARLCLGSLRFADGPTRA